MDPVAGEDRELMARAIGAASGAPVDDAELRRIWSALEARLPRLGAPSAANAAAAEMACHLLQNRLGARLPKGPQYQRQMEPLAAELHDLLGMAATADRSADWMRFVGRCAELYTAAAVPLRYRLLAQQWAKMACGRAFVESGRVLVPPTLDGTPPAPQWWRADG